MATVRKEEIEVDQMEAKIKEIERRESRLKVKQEKDRELRNLKRR